MSRNNASSADKQTKKQNKKSLIAEMTPAKRRKRTLRIVLFIAAIVLAVTAAAYFIGKAVLKKLNETHSVVQVNETYQSFNFHDVPEKDLWPEIDIFTDSEYASLDYHPSFESASLGGKFLIKDIPAEIKNEAHKFFEIYFEMLQDGNYSLYPSLFSDKYKKNMTGFETNVNREFPPQMVYDIRIKELARVPDVSVDGKNCIFGLYEVTYLIFKNNGLFRSDIGKDIDLGKDIARPLYFELLTTDAGTQNEKTYINNLYTESSVAANGASNK